MIVVLVMVMVEMMEMVNVDEEEDVVKGGQVVCSEVVILGKEEVMLDEELVVFSN